MNKSTIDFKLKNIAMNNSFLDHKKELEAEISELRLSALRFPTSLFSNECNRKANIIERKLSEAIQKRLSI